MFVVWEPWYIFSPELFTCSLKWPSVIRLASQDIGQVLLEGIVISKGVKKIGSRKIWLFFSWLVSVIIYVGRLHSDGLRSCGDVFLR
jgi:hypothetical protein